MALQSAVFGAEYEERFEKAYGYFRPIFKEDMLSWAIFAVILTYAAPGNRMNSRRDR